MLHNLLRLVRSTALWSIGIIGTAALVAALYWLPHLLAHTEGQGFDKDYVALVGVYRTMLVQSIGGLAILIGLYFTARNVFAGEQTRWTKTFSDSIGQLGSAGLDGRPDISIRVGAIHSLERLARDSPRDMSAICDVLVHYIEGRATSETAALANSVLDCASAIAVVGAFTTRRFVRRHSEVALSDIVLPNLILIEREVSNFHFRAAVLDGSRLNGSHCWNLTFEDCHLGGCGFVRGRFADIRLNSCEGDGINFSSAKMIRAHILNCAFMNSDFTYSCCPKINLSDSDFSGSDFSHADLRAAVVSNCVMQNVGFDDADLTRADLRGAKGINPDQLREARGIPPRHFMPNEWTEDQIESVIRGRRGVKIGA
jgi:uncharacterized protein YjbI with pentapeptide repeats